MHRLSPLWEYLIRPSCRLLMAAAVALVLTACASQPKASEPASQVGLEQRWQEAGGHYFEEFPERGSALLTVWVEREGNADAYFKAFENDQPAPASGLYDYDPLILVDGQRLDEGYWTELKPGGDRDKLDPRLIGLLPGKHTVEVQDRRVAEKGDVWGRTVRLEMALRPLDSYIVFVGMSKDGSAREVHPQEVLRGQLPFADP